ncbi:MAG: preprotein translocase subunit SecG [Planctomycetota bacterium]
MHSATVALSVPIASLGGFVLGWLLGGLSLFLILLILVQRGKGGGLTGALGGPGGQSAFGSKAGDTFTFITVVVAMVWGLVSAFTLWNYKAESTMVTSSPAAESQTEDDGVGTLSVEPGIGSEDDLPSGALDLSGLDLEGPANGQSGDADGGDSGDSDPAESPAVEEPIAEDPAGE